VKKILFIFILFLVGCGSKSSTTPETVVGLSTPAGADLISDNSSSSANLGALNYYAAFTDAGTDYTKDTARSYLYVDKASDSMEIVDIILCIINKTAQSQIPNDKYLAVLNLDLCNNSNNFNTPTMVNMTMETTRASNSQPQNSKIMYTKGDDSMRIDTIVNKEPTTSNPYGELTVAFSDGTISSTTYDDGSLKISQNGSNTNLEFIYKLDYRSNGNTDWGSTPYDDEHYYSYLDSYISSDGSAGLAKVGYVDSIDASKKLTYKLNWNATHIAQYDYDTNDALSASSCKSRTSFSEQVRNYNLYDTDGERIDITTYVYGYYTDASNVRQRIYISKRYGWFSGGETGSSRPTTITTRDGTQLSISYDSGDSGNYDSDNDGTFATITGMTLSDPIRFINQTISGSNLVYNDSTSSGTASTINWGGYSGNYFWGIPVVTINQAMIDETSLRKFNINDGTQITDTLGVNYILKQMHIQKTPLAVASSNCSTLTANAVDNESNITSKTPSNIITVDTGWAMPAIAGNNPKVIDGVLQF